MSAPASKGHVPALDGLRGLAIALVLLVHTALYHRMTEGTLLDTIVYRVFLAGWSGVDLFFTLSGFLITGILLDTRGDQRRLWNFYGRRFVRIFPPYYVFLTLYFVVAPRLSPMLVPPEMHVQGWYWSYLANVRDAAVGWKDPGLAHFWSLAVEEQFYLVWPFLAAALDRRALKRVCVACVLLAPALRVACVAIDRDVAAYVLTPCRLDALAAGAFVAIVAREGIAGDVVLKWAKRVGGGAAIAAIAIAIARRSFTHFDPVVCTAGISVTAVGFASLVAAACFAPASSRLVRALSFAPLRALGKYSYGFYIVHVPVLCLMALAGADLTKIAPVGGSRAPLLCADVLVSGALMFLVAWASWHVYEKRVLALKRYFGGERGASAVAATS